MKSASLAQLKSALHSAYLQDEKAALAALISQLSEYPATLIGIETRKLITVIRSKQKKPSLIAAFLQEYQLNTDEGLVLMEIAEALLRIPDHATQNTFLEDKLSNAQWREHFLNSDSVLVNMSTGALMLTGMIQGYVQHTRQQQLHIMHGLFERLGAPIIRQALKQAMQQLAYQFVLAETIDAAVVLSRQDKRYCFSFDMLGEAALTAEAAECYLQAYTAAIDRLVAETKGQSSSRLFANPGISIKLSALSPRYDPLHRTRAIKEISAKVLYLAQRARDANISVTLDAEEAERLEMSLEIFMTVYTAPELQHWQGFGLAVQAYQKRALPLLQWLAALASSYNKCIPVRLVKGAYWDSEIKKAQESGLSGYPVYTQKMVTDVAYLACAHFILQHHTCFYPQFASHNAHTLVAIRKMGKQHPGFEFQRLHGMGDALYEEILQRDWHIPCRVYAPVGHYQQLLPYLVRRLLENGANTSFINRIENPKFNMDQLALDPVQYVQSGSVKKNLNIPLPAEIYGPERLNSFGFNFGDALATEELQQQVDKWRQTTWQAAAIVNGTMCNGKAQNIFSPYDTTQCVGQICLASRDAVFEAVAIANSAYHDWRLYPVLERAACLRRAADLFEQHRIELACLCVREGGRTVPDALAEIREAIDFCRYYAAIALQQFAQAQILPGTTGEINQLFYFGRGVFLCISPWNFPVAIFTGQIAAALVSGNTVLAKPATQTPLSAFRCIQLLHEAGIPESVLHFIPTSTEVLEKSAIRHTAIAGIAFTGSTQTANIIQQNLVTAHRKIVPLIAETGGQNVLIADSSAHTEQLVQDVMVSAFNSAGQRCSALRVLFLQQEIADPVIHMLIGAMRQLQLGDPSQLCNDIGPVIDNAAMQHLNVHIRQMSKNSKLLCQLELPKILQQGSFFPPTLLEIASLQQLQAEVFGPVLHIIRYRASELESLIEDINAVGYGLTLGIHSRIECHIKMIQENVRVGNIYVNRNIIGAVVGAQPFGGMGLSGTGPKAGGPNYLLRFAVEQTCSVNTAAIGGNTRLVTSQRQ